MEQVAAKFLACVTSTAGLLWDSLYGLVFGFLISAIAQVVWSRGAMERALGPNLRGVINGSLFGIVASACSYGAVAAARGLYAKGADLRSVLAFTVASTNMNVAIVIMFWAMLGWQFAVAEFAGGAMIIAFVTLGCTWLLGANELRASDAGAPVASGRVEQCLQCGMEGEAEHAVVHEGTTYLFCGSRHESAFRADPAGVLAASCSQDEASLGMRALGERATWRTIVETMRADVEMLRGELIVGFVVAGCAAALVPPAWLSAVLRAVGGVPVAGYPLLLLVGLALAVLTFVCSMGNVPIARFLAMAGIPLGANTTFIYGDLLIPPLISAYGKAFPRKAVLTFLVLFVIGACVAGAVMDALLGRTLGVTMHMGSGTFSDRLALAGNVAAAVALGAALLAARRPRAARPATAR